MKLQLKMVQEQWLGRNEVFILFFLIGIHSMQGWAATTIALSYKEKKKKKKHKQIRAYRKSV